MDSIVRLTLHTEQAEFTVIFQVSCFFGRSQRTGGGQSYIQIMYIRILPSIHFPILPITGYHILSAQTKKNSNDNVGKFGEMYGTVPTKLVE